MTGKMKEIYGSLLIGFVFIALILFHVLVPKDEVSISERRKLAVFPKLSFQTVINGSFMQNFEKYAMDAFVGRDYFRKMKSQVTYYGLGNLDVHGIYLEQGSAVKMLYPLNEKSVAYAGNKFREIYENYLDGYANHVYVTIIPDKEFYSEKASSSLSLDYGKMSQIIKDSMDYASYVDITGQLSMESYYRTDSHWSQDQLIPVARYLAKNMGVMEDILLDYQLLSADMLLHGVYEGQSGLIMKGDSLLYVNNDATENAVVFHDTDAGVQSLEAEDAEMPIADVYEVYDLEKQYGLDPYDIFLSGAIPVLTIENLLNPGGRELVIFRDSFGSSLAPLLIEAYSRITLVDIRYVNSTLLGDYVDFEHADVLFLYSALLLNDSYSMK